MKSRSSSFPRLWLALGLLAPSVGALHGAEVPPGPDDSAAVTAQLTPDQVDELLGPIALYPDALIALILPASTSQAEIVLAARYIAAKGDPAQIDNQPWSDSVRALARYPEVLAWMDTNLQWTKQLGDAFIAQPAEVMNSIQRLRGIARTNGTLVSTPQQKVVVEDDAIEILPAEPDVIYVPRYDPDIVYLDQPYAYYSSGPIITFGPAFVAGIWLTYDFDWHRRVIWVGDRRHDWREHRDWRMRQTPGIDYPRNPNWHAWRPPPGRPVPPRDYHRPPPVVVTPRPLPGAPNIPHPPRPPGHGHSRPPGAGNNNPPLVTPRIPPKQPDASLVTPRIPPSNVRPPPQDGGYNRATPIEPPRATSIEPPRATPIQPPRATPIEQTRAVPPPQNTPQIPPSNRVAPEPRLLPPPPPPTVRTAPAPKPREQAQKENEKQN